MSTALPPPAEQPSASTEDSTATQDQELTLRALVSTKEAGVIIGKGGKNVADLRDLTGVKAGVSKVVPGINDRVLSISGSLESVAWAFSEIARQLVESPGPGAEAAATTTTPPPNVFTSVRLLISHNLMGTVIGRQGLKIKHIQDTSGARMVASKEMLPQSTERVVEVQGTYEAIKIAVAEIGRCLLDDWERGQGTVLYHPGAAGEASVLTGSGVGGAPVVVINGNTTSNNRRSNGAATTTGAPAAANGARRTDNRRSNSGAAAASTTAPAEPSAASQATAAGLADGSLRTQNISIPSDMVGCIIGRAGSKITEIRRLSGSKISIAKQPHDSTGERLFTIVGTPESNEKALFLLYNQLESEKTRRIEGAEENDGADE